MQEHPVAYLIFWGSYWLNNQGKLQPDGQLVVNYFNDVGGTSFENILTQYYDANAHIANTESLADMWVDTTPPPTATGDCIPSQPDIRDSDIRKEIDKAIQTKGWPNYNPNVTYFVYTPPDNIIYADDFPSGTFQNPCNVSSHGYCGYHYFTNTSQENWAYAVVIYPTIKGCQVPKTPNNNLNGDSLAKLAAHEQFEAITDPNVSIGWADSDGNEIGDKCYTDYHKISLNNGGVFELQSMYSNASHACVTSYAQKFQVSPGAVHVSTTFGVNLASQTLTIQNSGGTLHWQVNTGVPWLTVTPASGFISARGSSVVTLTFDTLQYESQTLFTALAFSDTHQSTSSFQVPITVAIQGTPQPGNWSMFGYDPQHTQYNPTETVINPKNVSNLTLDWSYNTVFNTLNSSAAVVNGIVYINTISEVDAIDLKTQALIWSTPTSGTLDAYSSPAVINGVVYVGSTDNDLYALDALTGNLKWAFPALNAIGTSPAVSDGIVYFGSTDGSLYAVDATTGTLKWEFSTGSYIETSPAVANAMVYFGTDAGTFYALDATTGTVKWTYSTAPSPVYLSPTIANGMFYLNDANGLQAFNATTGASLWVFPLDIVFDSSPAVANGVVFVGSNNPGSVYAVNATTGGLIWSQPLGATRAGTPAVANGVVYIATNTGNTGENGTFYAFDAATGSQQWTYPIAFTYSSPVVENGVVCIGAAGTLYAFHLPGTTP